MRHSPGRALVLLLLASATAHAASITITPSPMKFGATGLNMPVQQDATLANNGGQKFNITGATITLDNAEFSLVNAPAFPLGLNAGVSFPLTVQFSAQMAGQRMGELTVTSDDPQAPSTKIPLIGYSGPPAITLDVQTLIFPGTNVNAMSTANPITISNTGFSNLVVNNIVLGGTNPGDFILDKMMAVGTIPVFGSQKFNVTFAPTMVGQRSATVTITSNDPMTPSKVANITGMGTMSMLTSAPNMFDFGNNHIGVKSTPQNLTLGNMGNGTVHVMAVTFSGANPTAFNQPSGPAAPFNIPANGQIILGLGCTPDKLGALTATATITTDVGMATASLKCNGIAPMVSVTPNPVDFGAVPIMTASTPQLMTIANQGSDDLHIAFIGYAGADGPDFATMEKNLMFPITITAGMSTTFHVVFSPSNHRVENGLLQLTTDDPMAKTVMVPLTGSGVQAGIAINNMSLDFGVVPLGLTSAPKPFKITNTGDVPITIDTIVLGGAGAASFAIDNKGPITIPNGANMSQTVNATFTPAAVGAVMANVTISAKGLVPITVVVKGSGVGPMITVSPMMLDFGPENVGETSGAQTVTIKNGGGAPINFEPITASDGEFMIDMSGTTLPLAPGMMTTFGVKFAPTTDGMKNATIYLKLKGQTMPIASVSAAGVGTVVMSRGCSIAGRGATPLVLAPLLALLAFALRRRSRRFL